MVMEICPSALFEVPWLIMAMCLLAYLGAGLNLTVLIILRTVQIFNKFEINKSATR